MSKRQLLSVLLLATLGGSTLLPVRAAQVPACQSVLSFNCMTESLKKDQVALAWGDLFKWLGRHRGTKGIRKADANPQSFYCLMAPGKLKDSKTSMKTTTTQVWNRQPLFLWQGKMKKIEVYAQGQAQPLWTQALHEDDRSVVYDGPVLTPNRLGYYWQVEVKYPEKKETSNKTPRMSFIIMADAQANDLDQRLQKIDQRDLSPMEKAKRRIAVFREESYGARNDSALSGDILQELYALKSPSPELERLKSHDFCPDDQQPVTS